MTAEIEIESFLYLCGYKLREITKYYRVYETDPFHYNILLDKIGNEFIIATVGGEGIIVDLIKAEIRLSEHDDPNMIHFYWPTDRAELCQIISILTSIEMCKGLTKEECRAFKRFLVAQLIE